MEFDAESADANVSSRPFEINRRNDVAAEFGGRYRDDVVQQPGENTNLIDEMLKKQTECDPAANFTPICQFQDRPEEGSVGLSRPFYSSSQKFVVYSVAHVELPPRVHTPEEAKLRIYGCFADEASARAYAAEVVDFDQSIAVQIGPVSEWILAASKEAHISPGYMTEKRDKLLMAYSEACEQELSEFKNRLRRRRDDDGDEQQQAPPPATTAEETPMKTQQSCISSQRFPRSLEVREQQLAVVSFVDDIDPYIGEFLFTVYATFARHDEAENWIRGVAGDVIADHTFFVVSLYEWCQPSIRGNAEGMKNVHRSRELTKIVQSAETSSRQVDNFKLHCENEGIDKIPTLQIS